MNHSTNSNDQQRHYEELFRLLQECNPHLTALGYEPLHLEHEDVEGCNNNAENCENCREHCGGGSHCCHCKHTAAPDAIQNALADLAPGEYYILSDEDFNSLMDDLAELMESIDWLCRNFQAKEHLAKTLIGIAAKLDTNKDEHATASRIMESVDETMERWEDIELTPVSFE